MAYEINQFNVDFMQNRAVVYITDPIPGNWVNISVLLETRDHSENQLKDLARDAVRQALEAALRVL